MTPQTLKLLIGTDRDGLAEALKPHGSVIKEANEWRPLADHVIALIEMALKNQMEAIRTVEKERSALIRRMLKP